MRTIEHWIGGKATTGDVRRASGRVWNPATGEQQARGAARQPRRTSTPRCSAARDAFADWSQASLSSAHQGAVRVPRAGQRQHRAGSPRRSPTSTARCCRDARGRGAARPARSWSSPAASRSCSRASTPTRSRPASTSYSFREPLGVVRRDHAVQLPGHGADVDAPGGHRVRQHVRAQAERARPVRVRSSLPSCGPRPGCPTASSTSCTATRRPSTRCSTTRTSRRSRSSGRPRSRSTSTSGRPRTASGCRRSAAPRTTRSSCPTPTSTSPPTSSSRRPSARPASAAWRSRPPWRSAAVADGLVEKVDDKARAVRVGSGRRRRQRDGSGRHARGARPDRRAASARASSRAPRSSLDGRALACRRPRGRLLRRADTDRPGDARHGRLHARRSSGPCCRVVRVPTTSMPRSP